ncbi:hypothetical protein L1987_06356 [Smallanthus sonchifolius]|uniref:Uncharacterized protein n=1 Tax=Smallanthus sonchifolius TaxID=185202 RepID=A0ACB9JY45_9ASTR|nr:hypothetical protein L1987_06356 [Smallanthus sonchifolius]
MLNELSKIVRFNSCYSIEVANMVSLKEIVPAARNNINTWFIVLEKGRITSEGDDQNKTCLALVADESASVHF